VWQHNRDGGAYACTRAAAAASEGVNNVFDALHREKTAGSGVCRWRRQRKKVRVFWLPFVKFIGGLINNVVTT
jgi:hypothetical protein